MVLPVDLGAVHAMGAQFKHNIFEGYSKKALRTGKRLTAAKAPTAAPATAVVSGAHTTNFRTTKQGPKQPVASVPAGQAPKTPTAIHSGVSGAQALPPGRTITTPFTPGATPHSNTGSNAPALPPGKYRGIATPYQGGGRVIPMSGNAALTNRVNPTVAFSDLSSKSPVNRTAFNQPTTTPFKVNTIQNPKASSTPAAPPAQQFSSSPKPTYPLHVHPAGSSTQVLPHLTASQSEPGRPNTFTVGSRNAKAGGIAAMGSQLESWAQSRQAEIRASRKV